MLFLTKTSCLLSSEWKKDDNFHLRSRISQKQQQQQKNQSVNVEGSRYSKWIRTPFKHKTINLHLLNYKICVWMHDWSGAMCKLDEIKSCSFYAIKSLIIRAIDNLKQLRALWKRLNIESVWEFAATVMLNLFLSCFVFWRNKVECLLATDEF